MCGIAGIFGRMSTGRSRRSGCEAMIDGLAHRGPDDQGVFEATRDPLVMGHRRLAIIDTSAAGHQPMTSRCGRWTVVFNGEIYNASALAAGRSGAQAYRGHSDTEVLVERIADSGVEAAAQSAVGMFAFAAWDDQESTLYLVRDRIGIKPLYVAENQGLLGFASELDALGQIPELRGAISRAGIAALLRFGYIPGPGSIREGTRKLVPGTMLIAQFREGTIKSTTHRWWTIPVPLDRPPSKDDREAIEEVRTVVEEAVRDRLVADRPLGAFLSGGIDSSLVVGQMAALGHRPIRTYSIGFESEGYDEAAHARGVARDLGTDHTERYVTETDALELVPRMSSLFDEPFADSSQLPTTLVCQLARQDVVVALSGDGGDELFGGYDRYAWTMRLWNQISGIPYPLRQAMGLGLRSIPRPLAASIGSLANRCVPARRRVRNPSDKVRLIAALLVARSVRDLYQSLIGHWKNPARLLEGGLAPEEMPVFPEVGAMDDRHAMMMTDMLGYLPDDILVKVDRTSMSLGLEARVPLLDHRVVELAWSLPVQLKIRNGVGKWLLREVLSGLVSPTHWDRPKQGFGVPIGSWLRGPLREWAEDLLNEDRLRREGFFRPRPIRKTWQLHLSGTLDMGAYLWDVLMFQSWLEAHERS